jgi:hypothetical protein
MENYPKLIEWLTRQEIQSEFLLLHSASSSKHLYEQAECPQDTLGSRFGIILWEDALLGMTRLDFAYPGHEHCSEQDWQSATQENCDQ